MGAASGSRRPGPGKRVDDSGCLHNYRLTTAARRGPYRGAAFGGKSLLARAGTALLVR